MDIHVTALGTTFEYSQSPWYRVSETPSYFECKKKTGKIPIFTDKILPKLKIRGCFGNALPRDL